MLGRLRLRPIGWFAAVGTLAAMAATMVVVAPSSAASEKEYRATFSIECVLAPGVLNKKGTLTVTTVADGPPTLSPGQEFSLVNGTSTITTPAEWSTTLHNLGATEARGFVTAFDVLATNGTPASFNAAKGLHETEWPSGLPYFTAVENEKAMTFTAPSEGRHFGVGPYTAGSSGSFKLGVSTVAGFRETSAGHYESTGEGIQSTTEAFDSSGEQVLGNTHVSCTAPAGIVLGEAPIEGPAATTTTTTSSPTTSTSTTTSTTTTTTTTTTEEALKVKFVNWKLTGSLTVHKLGQTISLPEGCTFNGESEIPGPFTAHTKCPPFSAPLIAETPLGPLTSIGLEFNESEPVTGTITSGVGSKLVVRGTAKDNIRITSLGLSRVSVATNCETNEPAVLPVNAEETADELVGQGASFGGETTLPTVHCGGLLGALEASLIDTLMSGPGNPYRFTISPPA